MFTIYGHEQCTYCVKAKDLLESKQLAYEYINVRKDEEALAFIKDEGFSTVPQIYEDEWHVGGFNELVAVLTGGEA